MQLVKPGSIGILVLVGFGCGTHDHARIGTELDRQEIISGMAFDEPMRGRYAHLAIAPTVLSPEQYEPLEGVKKEYQFPREAFDQTLADILRACGGFETVTLMEEGGKTLAVEDLPERGLLLEVQLDYQSLCFREREDTAWGIFVWLVCLGFPAQWVHDQVFEIDMDARARITDLVTMELLDEVDLGECYAEQALNFHERTTTIWPYLLAGLIPPTTVSSDPEEVLRSLLPLAFGDALLDIRDALEKKRGVRIRAPSSDLVKFVVHNPEEGSLPEETAVDLSMDLVFPKDSSDLLRVTVNGDKILDATDESKPIPAGRRVPIEMTGVAFQDGRIAVSVLLLSQPGRPVEAEILLPAGGG
jgi:hypothetical protein